MVCIHHSSITQNYFTAQIVLCAPPIHPSLLLIYILKRSFWLLVRSFIIRGGHWKKETCFYEPILCFAPSSTIKKIKLIGFLSGLALKILLKEGILSPFSKMRLCLCEIFGITGFKRIFPISFLLLGFSGPKITRQWLLFMSPLSRQTCQARGRPHSPEKAVFHCWV